MTLHFISHGILNDLNLPNLTDKEQEQILNALSDRVQALILNTLLACANTTQKDRIIAALQANVDIEETITEIAGEIPQFSDILEQALIAEYENMKEFSAQLEK